MQTLGIKSSLQVWISKYIEAAGEAHWAIERDTEAEKQQARKEPEKLEGNTATLPFIPVR